MFNNYYDEIKLESKLDGMDTSGNYKYAPPRTVNAREVTTGKDFVVQKEGMSIRYNKEYQVPEKVVEGDKIDGRVVIKAERSRDVFGRLHFYIAKVK